MAFKNNSNVQLAPYNTLGSGGRSSFFTTVSNIDDLKSAVELAQKQNLPIFVLGGGSNVLFSDSGWSGQVIKMDIKGLEFEDRGREVLVRASAGENWDQMVLETVKRGLYGLENLSGIPGTAGATPIQNIGAYGVEIKDSLESVEVLDINDKKIKTISAKDCDFKYRHSIFKESAGKHYVVLKINCVLSKDPKPVAHYKDIKEKVSGLPLEKLTPEFLRQVVLDIRFEKFPDIKKVGTAGSFFKNPVVSMEKFQDLKKIFPEMPGYENTDNSIKIPLAWILDKVLNLKGYKKGSVALFNSQPLVLVNFGESNGDEVYRFGLKIANLVKERTGIDIEFEVTPVGNFV